MNLRGKVHHSNKPPIALEKSRIYVKPGITFSGRARVKYSLQIGVQIDFLDQPAFLGTKCPIYLLGVVSSEL